MSRLIATQDVVDELQDLHRGLHLAMENLIRNKEYEEAERILRMVDLNLARLIDETKIAK